MYLGESGFSIASAVQSHRGRDKKRKTGVSKANGAVSVFLTFPIVPSAVKRAKRTPPQPDMHIALLKRSACPKSYLSFSLEGDATVILLAKGRHFPIYIRYKILYIQ